MPPTRAKSASKGSGSTICPPPRATALRNRQFGMIFQFYHLLPELTALENVLSPLMIGQAFWRYLRHRAATSRAGQRTVGTWSAWGTG